MKVVCIAAAGHANSKGGFKHHRCYSIRGFTKNFLRLYIDEKTIETIFIEPFFLIEDVAYEVRKIEINRRSFYKIDTTLAFC